MTDKSTSCEQKNNPPLLGFAIVADLWLWGALLLYTPTYFNIIGTWRIVFNIFGFTALVVSFVGAMIELGNLLKNEGLSYWSVSFVFLLPGVILHGVVTYYTPQALLTSIAKVAVLILIALGGAMFFQGIPYLLWKGNEKQVNVYRTGCC